MDSESGNLDGFLFVHLHGTFIHPSKVSQAHISANLFARLWGCIDEQHRAHSLEELAGYWGMTARQTDNMNTMLK